MTIFIVLYSYLLNLIPMKLKFTFTILFTACLSIQAFSQDYYAQFNSLHNDTAALGKFLIEWNKNKPDDPELYVAYYNYFIRKSRTQLVSLDKSQQGEKSLQLKDPTTGKVVAYRNGSITYDRDWIEKAFHYIDSGIEKYPSRLDMRFGKIYMLGRINDYERFTETLVAAIDYSQKIDLKWIWTYNKPLDNPKESMLSAEQDYITQLLDAGDSQLDNIKKIAEAVLKYYPDNVANLSNLAITYTLKEDYNNALDILLKANTIAPTDGLVLNDIAYCYDSKGDKLNAIKYFKLAEKYGDDPTKQTAKQKLKELNKK